MEYKDENKEPLLSEDQFSVQDETFLSKHQVNLPLKQKIGNLFRPITQGSLRGSIFCLLCITFGSGILSLPYSMKVCGVALTLFLFFISAACIYYTLILLIESAYHFEIIDYLNLVEYTYGKTLLIITTIANLISNYGSIIVYQQISNLLHQIKYLIFSFLFLTIMILTVFLAYQCIGQNLFRCTYSAYYFKYQWHWLKISGFFIDFQLSEL